jgi:prepilin-type N-terminal cleavage/methylation domain-containing protein
VVERRARTGGFTLLELAVALAIISLLFGYAFRSLSGALDRLGRGHGASEALALAQSTLDRVGFDIPIGEEEIRGRTDAGFIWLVETTPYTGPRPANGALMGYVVQVTVNWNNRNSLQQVQLRTVRLGRGTPSS